MHTSSHRTPAFTATATGPLQRLRFLVVHTAQDGTLAYHHENCAHKANLWAAEAAEHSGTDAIIYEVHCSVEPASSTSWHPTRQ